MSLSFKRDDFPVLNRANEMKSHGFRIWYNSLWDTFNGGHDDELALDNPDESYGWLLEKKVPISYLAIILSCCQIISLKKEEENKNFKTYTR